MQLSPKQCVNGVQGSTMQQRQCHANLKAIARMKPRGEGARELDVLKKLFVTRVPEPTRAKNDDWQDRVDVAPRHQSTVNAALRATQDGAQQAATPGRRQILRVMMAGPLEMTIGVVGLVTLMLGVATALGADNPQLMQQCRGLLRQSLVSLAHGFWYSSTVPVRVALVLWGLRPQQKRRAALAT